MRHQDPAGIAACRVAQEPDARGAQLPIHVGVVNDFAGEVVVGVVNRPIHAIAEPELPREVDGQPPGCVPVGRVSDPVDQRTVVVRRHLGGDRVREIESLAKDQ